MPMRVLVVVACAAIAITAGLKAQAPDSDPADQLYTAIRASDRAQVERLLQNGADVNLRDRRGGATPLMYAAALGSLDTMKLLIEKGADVNARSTGGTTALMWAATDLAKVRLLVDRGADVNAVSERGRTALFLSAMSDQSAEIVRLLLSRRADAHAVDKEGTSTLLAASVGNDTATIRQLVEAGVNVNAANAANVFGNAPLMNAASHGNYEAVKLLLARGANVNAVSAPPGLLVKNGTIALGTFTPLILASAYGPSNVVKALLDAGADVNAKEARGMTPLMYSVTTDHGDIAITKMLIARGADLHVKTPEGETALDWAQKSGATPIVALLQRSGAKAAAMPAREIPEPAPTAPRSALQRSVGLIERSSGSFFVNSACGACHAQNVTDFAVAAARKAGVSIDDAAAARRSSGAAATFGSTATRLFERFDGPALDILLFTLGAFAAAGHPADRATDALIFNVSAQQQRDGNWHAGGVPRPPIEDGDFSRTALAVRALAVYRLPGRGAEMTERLQRAVAWLRSSTPLTAEDRSFRLLGLSWGGASANVRQRAASDIMALQRPDGGWGQRQEMPSDAYATGLTLYALAESRSVPGSSPAVQRGVTYLLSTQRADGSWFVRSRSPKFQPYFEGGFPYGHDQWISSMATGWATAALATGMKDAKSIAVLR
jgi:ankyrin repeat protein